MKKRNAPVAKRIKASGYEPEDCTFESYRVYQTTEKCGQLLRFIAEESPDTFNQGTVEAAAAVRYEKSATETIPLAHARNIYEPKASKGEK